MDQKKNAVCTIGIRQIEKNAELALGAPQKDIAKYEKVVAAYGNVAPAIVVTNGGMYSLIDGYARLEAYVRGGIEEIPAVVAQTEGEAEKLKLSLLLSASREQGSALSEGALIEKLVKNHGQTLGEISMLVGRSKAWLSKRQAMARNVSQPLRDMISGGTVCVRTAEEISKLPQNEQASFAANIVRERLNKDDVYKLVRMYQSPDATLPLCQSIIESPAQVLMACPGSKKVRKRVKTQGKIWGALCHAINFLEGLEKMICESDDAAIAEAAEHLAKLLAKMQSLTRLIAAYCPQPRNHEICKTNGQAVISLGKRGDQDD